MPGGSTPSIGPVATRLPAVRMRVRVRRTLRWVKKQMRRVYSTPIPDWASAPTPAATAPLVVAQMGRGVIRVASVASLRNQLGHPDLSGMTLGIDLHVSEWESPWSGWSGRLGPLRGVVHAEIRLPASGQGAASVSVTLAEPIAARRVAIALMAALDPWRPMPAPLTPEIATAAGSSQSWLPGGEAIGEIPARQPAGSTAAGSDVLLAPLRAELSRADAISTSPVDATQPGAPPRPHTTLTLLASPTALTAVDGTRTVLVDASTANATGRVAYGPDLPRGVLMLTESADGYTWSITRDGGNPGVLVSGRVGAVLDERQRLVLRKIGSVACAGTPNVPPDVHAAAIVQIAMTGILLDASALPPAIAGFIDADLNAILAQPRLRSDADPLEWEIRSVRQRTAALRGHAAGLVLRAATASASVPPLPTVSALLVTHRPGELADAVAAISAQTYPELEIVAGLHGFDLTAEARSRVLACGRPITIVPVPAEASLGAALALATRAASGTLVTKVDDDDRYGPDHVWDLVLARHFSGATVVGKGAEFVYLGPHQTTIRRRFGSELFTDVVAGGTMLLAKGDLEAVGGWRPIPSAVDRGLLDRVLRHGGLIYRTHSIGFIYVRNATGHTWDASIEYFAHDPRARWSGLPPYPEFGPP